MEVVDATRVLNVQPRLQKRLRGREAERDQGAEWPWKGLVPSMGDWDKQRKRNDTMSH